MHTSIIENEQRFQLHNVMLNSAFKPLLFILLFVFGQVNVSAVTIEDVEAAWERDDSVAAISLLTELANETKDSEFQLTLAMSYKNGWDVEIDHAKAIKWFKLAVAKNNPDAMAVYASYFYYGDYLEKDLSKAKALLQRAADMGSSEGQVELGRYFYNGLEGERDYITAKKWFDLAAEQNNTSAFYFLGVMYLGDDGLGIDYVLAYKWLSLVAIYNEEENYSILNSVKKKLNSEEIKKGEALVKEWLIKHPKKKITKN